MSLRVSNSVEKNVVAVPYAPILVQSGVPTDVLNDITGSIGEYAGRYIQNVGANDLYYAIGQNCDATNFMGILAHGTTNAAGYGAGQQLDVSNNGQRVSVYSTGGTTVAITLLKRNDNAQGQGGILNSIVGLA